MAVRRTNADALGNEAAEELPPQTQEQIAQYQNLQQQLQVIGSQRIQLAAKLKEIEMAVQELEKAKDRKVFKSIGMLLIEVDDMEALKKELGELRETYDLRVKTLERQEKRLGEKFQILHEQLSKAFGTQEAAPEQE